MEQTINKGRIHTSLRLFVLTGLLLLVYGFIFSMSAQDGTASGGLSEKIAALFVLRSSEHFDLFHTLVRKSAHVAEFLLLFFIWLGWTEEAFPRGEIPLTLGLPYGATLLSAIFDELHQLVVPGRAGQFSDVLIDMLGVTVVALVLLLYRRRRAEGL